MIRLRTVISSRLDPDVESHLASLHKLPRVLHTHEPKRIANQLPLILRAALDLRRSEADIILSVGEAALVSAMLTWRGPLVHLPVGKLTRTEVSLLRYRALSRGLLCVFGSHLAANDAIARGIDTSLVRVIRPAPPAISARRDAVRDKLGIDRAATCVGICGRVMTIGSVHTALQTAAILGFRDPNWRVLIDAGEQSAYVRRFFENSGQPHTLILTGAGSTAELAIASDVMLVDDATSPSLAGIAATAAAGVPIVASARMWRAEQLLHVPASLMTQKAARFWARAALDSVEGSQRSGLGQLATSMASSTSEPTLRHQWLEVLHEVCRESPPVPQSLLAPVHA